MENDRSPLLTEEEHRRSGWTVAIAMILAIAIGVAAALFAGSLAFRPVPHEQNPAVGRQL